MQYTDNVVEFMAHDLCNLPERTLKLLQVAAFFGGRFDIRDIAQYCGIALEEEEGVLWHALHQGTRYDNFLLSVDSRTLTVPLKGSWCARATSSIDSCTTGCSRRPTCWCPRTATSSSTSRWLSF
jgi:hypothetical protein